MSEDWYDNPKQKSKNFPKWLNLIWLSILTGISSGIIIALGIVIHSYVFPKPDIFGLSLTQEIQAIIFIIMFGATMGFIIGSPAALIFGPFTIFITKDFNPRIKYIMRVILGALAGIFAFYIFSIFSQNSNFFKFSFDNLIIPLFGGAIGAIIFLFFTKN